MRLRAQELCDSRGGRPGLPVPNKPDGFCGRKAEIRKMPGSDIRSVGCDRSSLARVTGYQPAAETDPLCNTSALAPA